MVAFIRPVQQRQPRLGQVATAITAITEAIGTAVFGFQSAKAARQQARDERWRAQYIEPWKAEWRETYRRTGRLPFHGKPICPHDRYGDFGEKYCRIAYAEFKAEVGRGLPRIPWWLGAAALAAVFVLTD